MKQNQVNAIVIEDEAIASRRIVRMLENLGIHILTVLDSVEAGINWFAHHDMPDVIFSDIQLGDGISFEILEAIERKIPVVFTTAYNDYMLRAFKEKSVDYLLKPIDEEELQKAVAKFKSFYQSSTQPAQLDIEGLKTLMFPTSQFQSRFLIKVGEFLKPVNVEDIALIMSESKLTYICLQEGKRLIVDDSLDKWQRKLNPDLFFRASRQFLISKKHVRDIVSYSNSRLKLHIDGVKDLEVIVSREKVREFKNWFESY